MTKEKPFILHALSPTKIVSPFDINMAYDSGFDKVATYTNITIEDVPDLVQDIVFSKVPCETIKCRRPIYTRCRVMYIKS